MSANNEPEGYVRLAQQESDLCAVVRWESVFAAAVILTLLVTLQQAKIYGATATLIDASSLRLVEKLAPRRDPAGNSARHGLGLPVEKARP